MNINIKKNIMDLNFQKNLIIASTSIVIAFTYIISLFIAYITNQINIHDLKIVASLFIFSIVVLYFTSYLTFKSISKIKTIPIILKNLEN